MLLGGGAKASGYEIHMGVTGGPALRRPLVDLGSRCDGAISADGRILATYLHGLFDEPESCCALLAWAGLEAPLDIDYGLLRERSIDRLADTVERHLDIAALFSATLRARGAAAASRVDTMGATR